MYTAFQSVDERNIQTAQVNMQKQREQHRERERQVPGKGKQIRQVEPSRLQQTTADYC